MNTFSKSITVAALALGLALAPASALAYYPYAWFTGTSYMTGPDFMVGYGGYQTGPMGVYSQGANYYGSGSCNQYYGCGSIGYNPMTGQGYGDWAGTTSWYNGAGGGYGAASNWQQYAQYIPPQAQQYMYGYGMGGYGGYMY